MEIKRFICRCWTAVVFLLLLLSGGCGRKQDLDAMPGDTPWNHGFNAIMETEDGWYSNLNSRLCLRYYEKATGTQIFLCGKPECRHDGSDSCTATYRSLETVNTLLYDGAIYTLAVENRDDMISFSLYRAAMDGSSFDKIGEAFSVRNSSGEEYHFHTDQTFIIHKGYAYIPYFLQLGKGNESGLVKMDIRTGKKEQLAKGEDYQDNVPENLRGCGDYVYFDIVSMEEKGGTYCYNSKDGTIKRAVAELDNDSAKYSYGRYIKIVTEEKLYTAGMQKGYYSLKAIDSKTGEYLKDEFMTQETKPALKELLYQDMLFYFGERELSVYTKNGKKLDSVAYEGIDGYNPGYPYVVRQDMDFQISNDKVYLIYRSAQTTYDEEYYGVYTCPVADITAGKGTWSKAYSIKSWYALENHEKSDIMESLLIAGGIGVKDALLPPEEVYLYSGVEELTITGVRDESLTMLNIPSEIGGVPVTAIGEKAFYGMRELKSVVISEGVERIGKGAFQYCSRLVYAKLPESVTELEDSAFLGCIALTDIVLPKKITKLGEEVFYYCLNLRKIRIPDGVEKLGKELFFQCIYLAEITVPDGVTELEEGVFFGCQRLEEVRLPDCLEVIGENAFSKCKRLKSIDFPEKLKVIAGHAFYECGRLEELVLPKDIKVGVSAFLGCDSLKEIVIPSGAEIETLAFSCCRKLEKVVVLPGAEVLGYAFSDCYNLNSLELSEGMKKIGSRMFYRCDSLTSVEIPASVQWIGEEAFYCFGLKTVTVKGEIGAVWPFGNNLETVYAKPGTAFYEEALRHNVTVIALE